MQNYDTGESKLRREFDEYGPIRRVRKHSNSFIANLII